jgi:predicted metal-dependent hydrolase
MNTSKKYSPDVRERAVRLVIEHQCLEYIIVHELAHLLERHHTERFTALMDEHLPQWGQLRKLPNTTRLGHETWCY